MSGTSIRSAMDQEVATRRLLDHPFYKAWVDGELSRDDLAVYAREYWHHVREFPRYLEAVRDRLPEGTARQAIEKNLADEIDGDHDSLWLQFADAVGAKSDQLTAADPSDQTRTCTDAWMQACASKSPEFALAMLYAYESQIPTVAVSKTEGLAAHYGVSGPGSEYFEVHAEIDVEHSRDLAQAVEDVSTRPEEAVAGAKAGAETALRLLDGIATECGIS
jgi:pyrroloquinoline-quinone synthase